MVGGGAGRPARGRLPPAPASSPITPLWQYADRPRRRLIAPDGPFLLPLAHTKLIQPIPTSHAAPVSHTLLYLSIRPIAESPSSAADARAVAHGSSGRCHGF